MGMHLETHSSFHRIVFPEGCAIIGNQAFEGCMGITSISLPKGVKIKSNAFRVTGLTELTIPEGATVEAHAFYECQSLKRVLLQEDKGWSNIKQEAFIGCKDLQSVTTTSIEYDDDGRYVLTTPREANPERPKDPYNTRVYIVPLDGKRRESPEKVAQREQELQESIQRAKQSGEWMKKGLCRYCGGQLEKKVKVYPPEFGMGLIGLRPSIVKRMVCKQCGKFNDYNS